MEHASERLHTLHLSFRTVPPGVDRLCRLLPLLAEQGVTEVVVDWEESFPWSIDCRMLGPGAFNEQEIMGICAVAERAAVQLIPRLTRHGLPLALNRVAGFAHLARIADDRAQLEAYAAAALRMAERVIDDLLEVLGGVPRIELGGVTTPQDDELERAYRQHYLAPLEAVLRSRGIGIRLQPALQAIAEPIECTIARALSPELKSDSALGRAVMPAAEAVARLDRFVEQAWATLRAAAAALHAAARHAGNRAEFVADGSLQGELSRLTPDCESLRAELAGILGPLMEPEVLGGYLARHLAPIEELAATTAVRVRALR
ncbi:MAG: hypothetical protein EA384_12995 [Spirochaetaceae bacterium]|nr:MAG: hypothetical protein EA384_12995 [Spirochaetaceae bacterium]